MNGYTAYARPATQYVDLPANPGYRVRRVARYQNTSTWYNVIGWRIAQADDANHLGWPIVVSADGIKLLMVQPHFGESLEILLPGQEVPE